MKFHKIAAGILAFAMVTAGTAPVIQNSGIIQTLTAQAVDSNWKIKEYYEIGDFTIQYVQSGYVQIIQCNAADAEEIVIPETMNDGDTDFPVKRIYPNAFQGCKMKKITFPKTLTEIGRNAFCNCTNLEEIIGTDNLEEIDDGAFQSCTSLKEIKLPDTLKRIGTEAFAFCTALTEASIPGNVTYMGSYVFTTCTGLKTLTFEKGIETIPDKIAYQCSALKTVNIPSTVTKIRDRAFELSALEKIVIPDTVKTIGEGTFNNCLFLKSVTLPNGLENVEVELFKDCHALQEVVIPDSVTRIRRNAFNGCNSLEKLTIPKNVARIEGYAFYGCENLKTVSIPDGVTAIDEYTFCKCRSLNPVTIPNTVTKIGVYAFYDCEALESITIPASVQSIGSYAFYDCSSLQTANFEGSMSEMGIWSFAGCTALKEITLPKDLEKLSNHVLYKCNSLETLEIPETVTKIDGYALAGCDTLTEVNVPASVETVGEYAVGYGEGVLPSVDDNVNIVSESPAIQEFCQENEVTINGEKPAKAEKLDVVGMHDYLHGKKKITQSQFNDADLNKDGAVNIYDWILMKKQNQTDAADAPETVRFGTVADEKALVRSTPSYESEDNIAEMLKKGDEVKIIGDEIGDWFLVEYPSGKTGYILQTEVSVVVREGNVSDEKALVRSTPSYESEDNIVEMLKASDAVKILANVGDWFLIEYAKGKTGYILQSEVAVAP